MNFSYKELIVYAIIAVIIVIGVATYATGVLNPYTDVSVRLVPISSTQNLYPYQIARFRVFVNNTGRTAISDLVVATYLNGTELNSSYKFSLPPYEGAEYNFSYIYTTPGTYDFQAIADPGRLFNIQNRSKATSSYETNVSSPSLPNVYTSVPNSNISTSQAFGLSQVGVDAAIFIATEFIDKPLFSNMVDSNATMVIDIFKALSPYMATVKGAYTSYKNSSSSYVAWIEGPINASIVAQVISSYGIRSSETTANGASVLYTKLSNTTSLCATYSAGWTKLIEYSNASVTSQTCANLASNVYNSIETQKFVNALEANPSIVAYSGNFFFANSVTVGSELIDYGNSIARMNITSNRYGIFSGYIKQNPERLNVSSLNISCPGVIYTSGNTSTCSYGISPVNQSTIKYLLINTTEIKPNYMAVLYSLVNSSIVTSIDESADALFSYINVSGASAVWTSPYKPSCAFSNTIATIPCKVSAYSLATGNAVLQISNPFGSPMRLNKIACFFPGSELNQTINSTVAQGGNTLVTTTCYGYLVGIASEEITYSTQLNYTVNGATRIVNGSVSLPTS